MADAKSSESTSKVTQKKPQSGKKAPSKGKPVTPFVPSGLEAVLLRNNFYRNNYRRMVSLSMLLCLVIAGLIGFIAYQHYTRPQPQYFATTEDGKLFKIAPLSTRNMSNNQLFEWATQAALASYTYDFVNYRTELQNAKLFYTAQGHASLLNAISASRNLEAVKSKKMTTSARITGNPTLSAPVRLDNGRFVWEVEFPMEVLYTNGRIQDQIIQKIIVNLTITRVPVWESSKGIAIKSIVVRENIPPRARVGN